MTITRNERRSFAAALLASVAITVALAGCSAPGQSGDHALKNGDAKAQYTQWRDAFEDCMKDKGFDMSKASSASTTQAEAKAMTEAADGCYKKVGNPPPDPSVPSPQEINAQMLAFAKCMRKAGYDYADPKVDPNGGIAMSQAMPSDWDTAGVDRCSREAGMLDGGEK